MKFVFFAFFASGLSMATYNTNLSLTGDSHLEECDVKRDNSKRPTKYYPKKVCNIDKSSIDTPEKLSNFGYDHRPAAYKIELNELTPLEDNERQDKF